MPGAVKTYSAAQVMVMFAGIRMTETGEDEFVRIKRNKPAFELKMSCDGYGVREQSSDDSAQMEVILLATSSINLLLTGIHAADKFGSYGKGIAPFIIKDLNSTLELHFAAETWIREEPGVTYARGVNERIWTFETDQLSSVHAGAGAEAFARAVGI